MEKQPTNIITEPGLYDIPNSAYHADPMAGDIISVSASILKEFARSPRHGWYAHPKLNRDHQPKHKQMFDLGSASHTITLGSDDKIVVIDSKDYKTKKAKEDRDKCYENDLIPVLAHQFESVTAMAAAARAQLDNHHDAQMAFKRGLPERTLIWFDRGVWCRLKLDWLDCEVDADGNMIEGSVTNPFWDFKSTKSAHPDDWPKRNLFGLDADIQVGMYRRGISAVLGIRDPQFRFVVQENEPPFALAVYSLKNHETDLADRRVERLLDQWRQCLEEDRWPGYPASTLYVDAPPWIISQREDEEALEKAYSDAGQNMLHEMLEWQAPLPTEPDDD